MTLGLLDIGFGNLGAVYGGFRLPFSVRNQPQSSMQSMKRLDRPNSPSNHRPLFEDSAPTPTPAQAEQQPKTYKTAGLTPSTSPPEDQAKEVKEPVKRVTMADLMPMRRKVRLGAPELPDGYGFDTNASIDSTLSVYDSVKHAYELDDGGSKTEVPVDAKDVANLEDPPASANVSFASTQSSFQVDPIVKSNKSIDEVLVFRALGDTSFTSPSTKPCSASADMVTIQAMMMSASRLLTTPVSEDVFDKMMKRFERVVKRQIKDTIAEAKAARTEKPVIPNPVHAAKALLKFTQDGKAARVQFGEEEEQVDLEIKWVEWLVEATATGVMHLKVPGCTCRPEFVYGDEGEVPEGL